MERRLLPQAVPRRNGFPTRAPIPRHHCAVTVTPPKGHIAVTKFAQVLHLCCLLGYDMVSAGVTCSKADEALLSCRRLLDQVTTRRVERIPMPRGPGPHLSRRAVYTGTRMHVACVRGCHARVALLLLHGAGTGVRDSNGATPLLTACRVHRDGVVSGSVPPLHSICTVQVLVSGGAALDVSYPPGSPCAGDTPLHIAATCCRDADGLGGGEGLLDTLLGMGGGRGGVGGGGPLLVNARNAAGHTPLHVLCDGYGRSGLDISTARAVLAGVVSLLRAGADARLTCEDGGEVLAVPPGAVQCGAGGLLAGRRVQPFMTAGGGMGLSIKGRAVRLTVKTCLDMLVDRLLSAKGEAEWPFTGAAKGECTLAWQAVARVLLQAGAPTEGPGLPREETRAWCRKAGLT